MDQSRWTLVSFDFGNGPPLPNFLNATAFKVPCVLRNYEATNTIDRHRAYFHRTKTRTFSTFRRSRLLRLCSMDDGEGVGRAVKGHPRDQPREREKKTVETKKPKNSSMFRTRDDFEIRFVRSTAKRVSTRSLRPLDEGQRNDYSRGIFVSANGSRNNISSEFRSNAKKRSRA